MVDNLVQFPRTEYQKHFEHYDNPLLAQLTFEEYSQDILRRGLTIKAVDLIDGNEQAEALDFALHALIDMRVVDDRVCA